MASLAEYFLANRYIGKWQIGDRISGRWNRIPFIGTVGNDSVVNDLEGPMVSVHLDLPIKHQGQIQQYIRVKPTSIKRLVEYKDL